jgi:aryl-alcohol dehydrogenase-like predicted oxidoreductase
VGINWIDTAPAYGLGHAEEIVGRALAGLNDSERPLLFTKCGLVWEAGETNVSNVLAASSIRRECEASLRRLRVECLDLLQVHWPAQDGTPPEESWSMLASLVEEGKTRAIGVSNFDLDLLERCQAVRPIDTYQPELNMIRRGAAAETIPWAEANGCGVIVYSPMRCGLLSGRFSVHRAEQLDADDWRRRDDDFHGRGLRRNLALVDCLRPVAERLGCSLPQLAVAWTLAWPGVSGAIVGARHPEQVDSWIGAGDRELNRDDLVEIGRVIERSGAGSGPSRPREAIAA